MSAAIDARTTLLTIQIGEVADICATGSAATGGQPKNANVLILSIYQTDGAGNLVQPTPGTFIVHATPPGVGDANKRYVVAQLRGYDASCTLDPARSGGAGGGTGVTLTGAAQGTVNLTIGSGAYSGSFNAQACPNFSKGTTCQ